MPCYWDFLALWPLLDSLVAGIAKGIGFLTMQERLGLGYVTHVGGSANYRMHQAGLGIDADVRLHAEMPLIAFLRLMHLLIPFAFPVLGRGGCCDQGRVDNRSFTQQQTFLG